MVRRSGSRFPEPGHSVLTVGALFVLLLGCAGVGSVAAQEGVADGPTLYFGSDDGTLYAVDAETGEREWVFTRPEERVGSPIAVDGTAFVGSLDGRLYAVDAETGEQEWAFNEQRIDAVSSPTVVDSTAFFGSQEGFDGALYAVDAETGEKEWVFSELEGRVASSPTVVNNTVYVGSLNRTLYAVDAETGEQEWLFNEDDNGSVVSSATVVDNTVYIGSLNRTLYAVDAATGEQEWAFEADGAVVSSPTIVDGKVYFGTSAGEGGRANGTLYAVDAETGEREWAFTEPDGWVLSSPTVVDISEGTSDGSSMESTNETVYVGSLDRTLYAVDAETGEKEWAFTEPSHAVFSSPTVANVTVYVGSLGGTLYAVNAETGEREWGFVVPQSPVFSSPTVVENVSDNTDSIGSRVLLGTLNHHDDLRAGVRLTAEDLGKVETERAGVVPSPDRDEVRVNGRSAAYETEEVEVIRKDVGGGRGMGVFGFSVLSGFIALFVGTALMTLRRYR